MGDDAGENTNTRPTPTTFTPPPGRRIGATQKEMERGIIIWVLVFTFVTHIIAFVIWGFVHFSGRA